MANLARPKLPQYTGSADQNFDIWFKKFELFVPHPPPEGGQPRHQLLPLHLDGQAFTTYDTLPPATKADYALLKQALRDRLVPGDHNLLKRQEFMGMTKRPDEAMTGFELRIMEAVALAYADFNADARDALAKEQFIRGIGDGDMQLHLLTHNPANLRNAVHLAQQYDQVQRVAHGKSVNSVGSKDELKPVPDPMLAELSAQVKNLSEQIAEMRMERKSVNKDTSNQGSGSVADPRNQQEQGRGRGKYRGRPGNRGYQRDRAPGRGYQGNTPEQFNPPGAVSNSYYGNKQDKDRGFQNCYQGHSPAYFQMAGPYTTSTGENVVGSFPQQGQGQAQQNMAFTYPTPDGQRQWHLYQGQPSGAPMQDPSTIECDRCGELGHKWRKCPKGKGQYRGQKQGE